MRSRDEVPDALRNALSRFSPSVCGGVLGAICAFAFSILLITEAIVFKADSSSSRVKLSIPNHEPQAAVDNIKKSRSGYNG